MLRYAKYIILVFIALVVQRVSAQLITNSGTDFWFAFPEMYDQSRAVYWVNITSNDSTGGTVSIPGTTWTQNFSVKAGQVARVNIPSNLAWLSGSNTQFARAIHVDASDPVVVFAVTYHAFRHEASLILPNRALGTRYRATTYKSEIKSGLQESEFVVVAAGDTAVVEITPRANIAGGRPANTTYTVTIPPNYVYQAQANSVNDDLTGTLFRSKNGKAFAVYSGNVWSTVICTPNSDPLFEGMFPTNTWGKDYFVIPTPPVKKDYIRIVADRDTTRIYRDGTLRATINAGQFYQETITQIRHYTSNNPISVAHFLVTGQNSCTQHINTDPSMIMLNATEQMFLDSITFFAVDTSAIDSHFVHVITGTADTSQMYLDSIRMRGWNTFSQNRNYSYKTARVKPGYHRLETKGCGFIAYSMGIGRAVSYGYATGVSLVDLSNSITYTNFLTGTDTICKGDTVKFKSLIRGNPKSFKWYFGDGDSSTLQNPIHKFDTIGDFYITAIVRYPCLIDTLRDTLHIPPPPQIDLGPDTILCHSDTLKFTVNTKVFRALWSTGSRDSFLVLKNPGTYWAKVYNYCGEGYDTVKIDSLYPDTVALDPDTILCRGDTIHWDISAVWGSMYKWWDNSTGPKNYTDTSGLYWAEVKNQCGTLRDSIQVFYEVPPKIDFGPDTTLCDKQRLQLLSYFSRSTYKWHNGNTWPIYNTLAPGGKLWCEVTNLCGQTSDTIVVNYDYPLNPNLGNDSVVCIRDTLLLDPVTNGATCLWQDNSTDTTHQVFKAGKYWVAATNACGTYSDTVVFAEEHIPQVTLPNDTLICNGQSISMDVSFSGCNYRWNTGDTTPNYTINSQGHYAVTITNICGTATDDIHVLYDRPLVVSLGNDTLLCDGDGFYIDLNYPNNPNYLWNTGHASGKIRIQHGGTYTVTVTNRCGKYFGTKQVTALYTPKLNLGNDTIFCYGEVYTIKSGIEHGKALGLAYNWNNGRDGAAISVRETGNYWLHAKNICGEGSDSVYVQFNPIPALAVNDTLICPEEELDYDYSKLSFHTLKWISDKEDYTGNFYTISEPGRYRVIISDSIGCSGQDWFKVEPCPTPLWVPNAFTPNGDPRNNTFKAYKDGLEFFEMKIYDRWNKLIFESNDINDGWDGNFRRDPDQRCAQGMYIWKISFRESENHQLQIKVGEVYLYR